MKCNHKWVDVNDGSRDKICSKCFKKAKQAVMSLPITQPLSMPLTKPLGQPMLRETIIINTGESNLGKVSVYKDELLKQIKKQLSIHTNFLS